MTFSRSMPNIGVAVKVSAVKMDENKDDTLSINNQWYRHIHIQ